MSKCNKCSNEITMGNLLQCPNCGLTFCTDCAKSTKRICPKCYSDIEYIG